MSDAITLSPSPHPINATVQLAGSKSYTNRALIIAALAEGQSTLHGASLSKDSIAMLAALRKLGIETEEQGDVIRVQGGISRLHPYNGSIDIGPAGTTMRFLTALCAWIPGSDVVLSGSERMHERPIHDLVEALQSLGASIEYLGKHGCPPLRIRGTETVTGDSVGVACDSSSQFLSALLLVAPALRQTLTLHVRGNPVSLSYVAMTLDSMRSFGAEVTQHDNSFVVKGNSPYQPREYRIECDASGASYLWGFAAMSGGRVRVTGVNPHSVQGDIGFPALLKQMGCSVTQGSDWIEVAGTGQLQGIQCDMTNMPDTAQTLAVVAAVIAGSTTITGLSTLRIKETDRLAALQTELQKAGISSRITDDSITIHGGSPRHADIATYEDHRMAMSFALLGATPAGVTIHEPTVVEKSFPHFWHMCRDIGLITAGSGLRDST